MIESCKYCHKEHETSRDDGDPWCPAWKEWIYDIGCTRGDVQNILDRYLAAAGGAEAEERCKAADIRVRDLETTLTDVLDRLGSLCYFETSIGCGRTEWIDRAREVLKK